jgi:hypothetical protein
MLTLLAATSVALAPLAPPPQLRWIQPNTFCKETQGTIQTSGPDPALLYRNDGQPLAHRLGDLPKANLYHTVLRSVGGCAVTRPVAYSVGR